MTIKFSPVSFLIGLAALILSGAGQYLLKANHILLAIICFILAAGIFVFVFRKQPGPQIELSSLQPVQNGKWLRKEYITGGGAILFAALAFWMFTTSVPSIYPWLLHLISIALLVLSIVWAHGANNNEEGDKKVLSWSRLEILFLLGIFGIGLFMRLYRFDQIPFGTWFDEADNGLNALKIINRTGLFASLCGFYKFTRPFFISNRLIFSNIGSVNPRDQGCQCSLRSGNHCCRFFCGSRTLRQANRAGSGFLSGGITLGCQLEPDRHAWNHSAFL